MISTRSAQPNARANVLLDSHDKHIVIFNVNNNTLNRYIRLSSGPFGVIEVKEASHSSSVIAVTFPWERQIIVIDIQCKPARIIQSIDVDGECYELWYCKGKYVLLYMDQVYNRLSIGILDRAGGKIQCIYPDPFEGVGRLFISMSRPWYIGTKLVIHQESETIYVVNNSKTVISINMNGQLLNRSVKLNNSIVSICVDLAQNVYVSGFVGNGRNVLKLSGDLHELKVIDVNEWIESMTVYKDTFYMLNTDKQHITVMRHT